MSEPELVTYSVVLTRWTLAAIFLTAGILKSRDIKEFALTIRLFRLLPAQFSNMAARLTIAAEFMFGLGLLLGFATRVSAAGGALLLTLFLVAILLNWARSNILECNCFGPYLRERIGGKAVLRNAMLIAFCIVVVTSYDGYLALESVWARSFITPSYSIVRFVISTMIMVAIVMNILLIGQLLLNANLLRQAEMEMNHANISVN